MASAIEQLNNERVALGLRPTWRPKKLVPGPFIFAGVITDNLTTPSDLTADAVNVDQALQRHIGGGADAGGILQVEAVEFFLENGTETPAIVADILENVYLRHEGPNFEERISLAPFFATSPYDVQAVADTTTAGPAQIRERGGTINQGPKMLPYPWVVNLRTDTFEVAMRVGVNSGADVPYRLHLHGAAWREAVGVPAEVDCPDRKAALRLRVMGAAAKRAGAR